MFAFRLDRYRDGLRRLKIQANEMNVFDHVQNTSSVSILNNDNPSFSPQHRM